MPVQSEEAQLVARCRAGEDQAWNELVERFSRYVYAIAVQGFRLPRADAEDVFQEVFLRVYDRLDTLRNDEAFRPWIAQLTRRLCLDKLSAGGRETAGDVEEEVAEDTLAEIEAAWDVHEALAELGTRATSCSTASLRETRATGRSATRCSFRPGRSRAGSRAAWPRCGTGSREETTCLGRLEVDDAI